MANTPFDRALDFITSFRAKYQNPNGRTAGSVFTHWFGNLEYVEAKIGNGERVHEVRLFRDGAEQYSYWLDADERRPIVAKMMLAGMKQSKIAQLLKFSPSTIGSDVKYLRVYTTLLASIESNLRPLTNRMHRDHRPALRKQTYSNDIVPQHSNSVH